MDYIKQVHLTDIQRMVLAIIISISVVYLAKSHLQPHLQLEQKKYLQLESKYRPASLDQSTKCSPHTKLYYLKIHKTGSDTFSNILKRFTQRKSLKYPSFSRFCLFPDPSMTSYLVPFRYLYSKMQSSQLTDMDDVQMSIFRTKALEENKGSDVIDYHTIFNESAVQEILGTDAVNIVSLRHPLSHMISITSYLGTWKNEKFKSDDHVLEYLTNPWAYEDTRIFVSTSRKYITPVTQNFMAYSLGYYLTEHNTVDEFLSYISHTFPLVIILEKYSQSLLLVKRKLCWELKDILYIRLNSQQTKDYNTTLKSSRTNFQRYETLHRKLSIVDYALYDLFSKRNDEDARSYGADFEEERVEFENTNSKVNAFCWNIFDQLKSAKGDRQKYLLLEKTFEVSGTTYNVGFTVNGTECLFMIFTTNSYAVYLQIKQYPEICELRDVLGHFVTLVPFHYSFCRGRSLNIKSILLKPNFWLLRNPFEKH